MTCLLVKVDMDKDYTQLGLVSLYMTVSIGKLKQNSAFFHFCLTIRQHSLKKYLYDILKKTDHYF